MRFHTTSLAIPGTKSDTSDFAEEPHEDPLVYRVSKVSGVGNWNPHAGSQHALQFQPRNPTAPMPRSVWHPNRPHQHSVFGSHGHTQNPNPPNPRLTMQIWLRSEPAALKQSLHHRAPHCSQLPPGHRRFAVADLIEQRLRESQSLQGASEAGGPLARNAFAHQSGLVEELNKRTVLMVDN